jgi:hypothetical protein
MKNIRVHWLKPLLSGLVVILALGGTIESVAAVRGGASPRLAAPVAPPPSFPLVLLSGDQQRPALAYNPGRDEYLLVWESGTQQGGSAIGARLVSADGATLGTIRLLTTEEGAAYRPAVAYNPVTDEFLVVWHEYVSNGPSDILGQRLSSTGALRGARLVITAATMSQQTPAIACNPTTGMYFVAWTDLRSWDLDCYSAPYAAENACADIYGVRVGTTGAPLPPEMPLSPTLGNQFRAEVTCNPNSDRFIVAWTSYVDAFDLGDIVLKWVGGDGVVRSGPLTLPGGPMKEGPAMALAEKANANILTWHDNRYIGGSDIFSRRVFADGGVGAEVPVEQAPAEQIEAAVASDGEKGYLVVWQDRRNAGDAPEPKPHDIYARCVDLDGASGDSWQIYKGEGDQSYADVAYASMSGSYLVAWQDNRAGAYGIYGAVVGECSVPVGPAGVCLPWVLK